MFALHRGSAWPAAAGIALVMSAPAAHPQETPGSILGEEITTEKTLTELNRSLDVIRNSGTLLWVRQASRPAVTDPAGAAGGDQDIAKALETIQVFSNAVDAGEKKRKGWSGKIHFGGGSDQSTSGDKSKVKVGAEMALGTYPGQLRLKFEGAVDQDASLVKEEVTSMLANYDYYLKPGREVHGFVERFTDSFLDIGQRYEIGLGMRFEWTRKADYERRPWQGDFQPLTRQTTPNMTAADCRAAYTRKGCDEMGALLEAQAKAADAAVLLRTRAQADPAFGVAVRDVLTRLDALDLTEILNGQRKMYTRWEVSFSVGALAEYENPLALKRKVQTLDVADLDGDGDVTEVLSTEDRSFSQPSDQRFRLSLKPSVIWRPGERTELFVKAYYKPALDAPRRVDGAQDYRADVYAGLKWDLPSITRKDGSTTIVLNYELHYDNVPPQATATLDPAERLDPDGLGLVSAKRHRMVKLMVEIPL